MSHELQPPPSKKNKAEDLGQPKTTTTQPPTKKKIVKLQVPKGCVPGSDTLTFLYSGQELEFPIPKGSKPGDILEIRLGAGDDGDSDDNVDENDDNISIPKSLKDSKVKKVPLHSSIGKTLDIYSSIPTTTVAKTDNDEMQHDADGTNAMAWPAGLHLASCISSSSSPSSPLHDVVRCARTVVELGSGSGLGGLAFAATALSSNFLSSSSSSSTSSKRKRGDANKKEKIEVLLTDVPSAMNLLKYNVERNRDRLASSSSSQIDNNVVRAMPLVWGKDEDANCVLSSLSSSSTGVELILGSDLLYKADVETLQALSSTIQAIDMAKKATILLSVRWRKPEDERKFFREMEDKGYDFRLVVPRKDGEEGRLNRCSTLGWREFGNPACNGSNKFFTESCVLVDKVKKALKDVSEGDMDDMGDEEHDAFERMFIQIYVGQWRLK